MTYGKSDPGSDRRVAIATLESKTGRFRSAAECATREGARCHCSQGSNERNGNKGSHLSNERQLFCAMYCGFSTWRAGVIQVFGPDRYKNALIGSLIYIFGCRGSGWKSASWRALWNKKDGSVQGVSTKQSSLDFPYPISSQRSK